VARSGESQLELAVAGGEAELLVFDLA